MVLVVIYTHACAGAGRYEDAVTTRPRDTRKLHGPHGWESPNAVENCPECGDDAPIRGCYGVVAVGQ